MTLPNIEYAPDIVSYPQILDLALVGLYVPYADQFL